MPCNIQIIYRLSDLSDVGNPPTRSERGIHYRETPGSKVGRRRGRGHLPHHLHTFVENEDCHGLALSSPSTVTIRRQKFPRTTHSFADVVQLFCNGAPQFFDDVPNEKNPAYRCTTRDKCRHNDTSARGGTGGGRGEAAEAAVRPGLLGVRYAL